MITTPRELVTKAWYWSGLVARGYETPGKDEFSDGMDLLNFVLENKAQDDSKQIPYLCHLTKDCEAGEPKYFIENLCQEYVTTYNLNPPSSNVRFPLTRVTRYEYLGVPRVMNVNSLPYEYYTERVNGGMTINLYFPPNANYQLNICGKLMLTDVASDDDLTQAYDQFYINYLTICTAVEMCDFYKQEPPPRLIIKHQVMEKRLTNLNAPDVSQINVKLLNSGGGMDIWSMANLYKGFWPS